MLMGPVLQLTAMPRPGLPFNGCCPRDPYNYMELTLEGWKAELA